MTFAGCNYEELDDMTTVTIEVRGETGETHQVVIQESYYNISYMIEFKDLFIETIDENMLITIKFEQAPSKLYKLVYKGSTSSIYTCDAPQEKNIKAGRKNNFVIDSRCN